MGPGFRAHALQGFSWWAEGLGFIRAESFGFIRARVPHHGPRGLKQIQANQAPASWKKLSSSAAFYAVPFAHTRALPSLITNRQQIKRQPLENDHPLSGSVSVLRYPFTEEFTVDFTFYHCKMLHFLQCDNCKFTVLPDILTVNLQCAFPLHCKYTVGTCSEIDARAMAFTMGIQWFYNGHTVYLQCVHCKIIQCRELLSSLPL